MNTAAVSDSRIDRFLALLRAALRGMPDPEIEDILKEMRSHIMELAESSGGDVDAAIRSIGDPAEMAGKYLADRRMVRAECSGSPLVILQGLRHASESRLGRFAVTVLYIFGYVNVLMLLRAGVAKLLAPAHTGLWYTPGDRWPIDLIIDGNPPAGGRELWGWWLVPITLTVAFALRYVTDHIAQWWIARFRRAHASKEG
jgi:hypothetical protein